MNDKIPMSREEQLLKAAAQQVDASPLFKYELEKKIMNAHKPTPKFGLFSIGKIASAAGWAIGLAVLALTFIWVIRSIAPQPQPAVDNTPSPAIETVTPRPRIVPEGKNYKTSSEEFIMTVDFPESPAQADLYQLDPVQENADYQVETIRDLANRIGINGTLYLLQDHNGGAGFMFTDGKQRIEVRESVPYQYVYYTDISNHYLMPAQSNTLSLEEMSAIAEEFLKAHGLLDFPYQINLPADVQNRTVTFASRLSDLPESYTFNNLTTLQVTLDQNGEIFMVNVNIQPCESIGNYSLITAEQAWDKFIANELNGLGVEMQSYGYTPTTFKRWERDAPLGQPTSIIGSVESFSPVDGDTFLFIVDGIPLAGNLEGLTNPQETVQLDGQFIMDGDVKKFQVDGWKVPDPMSTRDGTLEQVNGQPWLVTTDGQHLQLDNVPADIPFGERTVVNGIISGDKLDWKTIDQGEGGGGGGGGGGGAGLARLNLSGTPMPTATPWPASTPVDYGPMIGTRFEGERGTLNAMNLRADDGSTHFEYTLSSDSETGFLDTFWQVTLEGPATQGLEAYYRLPIKVWGTIASIDQMGNPVLQLDRYEAVYPDQKVQVWFGQETAAKVEGKDILLFTTDDGTVYVRNDSIQFGGEPSITEEGLVSYIVGWVTSDQTFGGYPVMNIVTFGTAPKDFDFDPVISEAAVPPIMDKSNMNLSNEPQTGTIDRIELVYLGEDQLLAEVKEGRTLYVQPFWRFSGYYSETSFFEIIVQALPDEYLQPVPLQDIE